MTPRTFNQIEVGLWTLAAVVFLLRAVRDSSCRRQALVAAVAFLFFAGSDAMEVRTGAWWRPWWLLAWKATCVLTFAGVWWTWPRSNDEPPDQQAAESQPTQSDPSGDAVE